MICQFCNSNLVETAPQYLNLNKYFTCKNCKIMKVEDLFDNIITLIPSKIYSLNIQTKIKETYNYNVYYLNITNVVSNLFFNMLNIHPQYVFKLYENKQELYDYYYLNESIQEHLLLNSKSLSNISPSNFDQKLKTILTFS